MEKKAHVTMDPETRMFDIKHQETPAPEPAPKYPYYPPEATREELIRMELLSNLNHWANNDPDIARSTAKTFIDVLKKQFDLPGE